MTTTDAHQKLIVFFLRQNDFFDKMSKTETFASADMKGKIDRGPKKTTSEKKTTVSLSNIF